MIRSRRAAIFAALVLGVIAVDAPAAAQGRSGEAPGTQKIKAPRPAGGPTVPSPGNPSPALPHLASWLDDASSLSRGEALLGISVAYWTVEGTRVWFAPSAFVMAGVTDRIGVGASVPVYSLRDPTGATMRGVGDVTIFGKFGLINPEVRTVGVAFAPVVVVFEDTALDGGRRVAWAVPVSLEARLDRGRVYGSAGYFSSGAAFFNGAIELTLASKWALGGTLGSTFATGQDTTIAGSGRRTDASVSVMFAPAASFALSASVGRSFSGVPELDGGPWVAAGFAIRR